MAVAWTATKVGRANIDVTVRDPVVLTATLPRFLLNGDHGTMSFDLDNVEAAPGDYSNQREDHGSGQGHRQSGHDGEAGGEASAARWRWRSTPAAPAPRSSTSISRVRTG